MTRSEILSLPAGPELDALVAEKVMGWHSRIVESYIVIDHPSQSPYRCWLPSKEIAHAWEVVEKIRATKDVNVNVGKDDCHVIVWGDGADDWFATGEPAPLAICRAALLAVMEKK